MEEENMKISVEHFGPIAEARDIELRPLTVFVGPSNTGKSYLAVLIYALFNSSQSKDFLDFPHKSIKRRSNRLLLDLFNHEETISDEELTRFFKKERDVIHFSDFPEKLQALIKEKMGQWLAQAFHEELPRCMGISTKDNPLMTNTFLLHGEDKNMSFTLSSFHKKQPTMEIKNFSFEGMPFRNLGSLLSLLNDRPQEIKSEIFFEYVLRELRDIASFSNGPESFYLPAARTGIMQSHQAIAAALIKRAPLAGLEPVSVPTLSGIVSDFLQEIITMDTSPKEATTISNIADEMEEKVLKGFIKTKPFESIQYPQFLYRQNGLEIPLLCSSSMVSELAPVVLFIRHRVGKGDLLIIEEPEAHLHPEAQRGMAAVVVRLVRAGVRVMVTTHSGYFLDQLANAVRLSKLTDCEEQTLKEEEIGAYVFKRQEGKGTIVEKLHFDQETGLSPEDHDTVSSDLYNETVEILERLDE